MLAAPRHLQQLFVHVLTTLATTAPARRGFGVRRGSGQVVSLCSRRADSAFRKNGCATACSASPPDLADLRELRTSVGWVEGWEAPSRRLRRRAPTVAHRTGRLFNPNPPGQPWDPNDERFAPGW